MQTISGNYNTIVTGQYRVGTKFIINGVAYDMSNIKSATIDGALFEELTIGNAITRELHLTLKGMPTIPRGAKIVIQQRVYNATLSSGWAVLKGTFYISKRNVNRRANTTKLIAYDAMNKMDAPYLEQGTWGDDTTALTAVQNICSDVDITLDSATAALLGDGFVIGLPPAIGLNGTTRRQMLQEIGVLYGGNWIINDLEELELIPLKSSSVEYTVVGNRAGTCVNQAALPAIDRVKLTNGTSEFKSVDFDSLTGTALICNSAYANDANVARVLAKVSGYVYQPYSAERAYVEPAAGLGDGITIFGLNSVIAKQSIKISNTCPSNVAAEYTAEEDDEYEYVPPQIREVRQKAEENYAAITILPSQIMSEVYTKGETDQRISSSVTQTATELTISFDEKLGTAVGEANAYTQEQTEGLRTYFTFGSDGLTIGKSDSPFKTELSNTELAFTGESGEKAAWINANQLNIQEAVIPATGDIQLKGSSGKWVQQVRNDHFQIRWVGN